MRILHKFKINEISAVDKPAQAHAKAVIMKRADDEDMGVLDIAKRLVDSGGRDHGGVTSDVYHKRLTDLAIANRLEGETVQRAYVRLAETTETGALLFKAAMWGPPPKQAPQDFADPTPKSKGPAQSKLDALVDEFVANYNRTNSKRLSRAQGYDRVFSDPANRELRDAVKAEERRATREVADSRAVIDTIARQNEADFRLRRSPGSARM
jgi:hypothetical protein